MQLPRQSLDGSQVHPILHELVQCLYKGKIYICHSILSTDFSDISLANDQQSMLILNNGILYLVGCTCTLHTSVDYFR